MKALEYFLEKYESNLDSIVIGGGWAVEIFQDRAHDPRREHHDIDTLVLDENLDVEGDSHNVPCEYFGSIDVEGVDWLLDFIVEKQVVCKGKVYDVKVLCPEFIVVSKVFSSFGLPREKDNEDIEYIFETVDLDRGKISSLIEKASLLPEGSNFLELLAEKGLETASYSRDDFNKKILQEKFSLEKIPEQVTSETLEGYDFLFLEIKKGLGAGWIKNHKKRTQEILNNTDIQKAISYGAISYGLAIRAVLEYAGDDMKQGLVDRILGIPNAQEARIYGLAIRTALMYARDDMKQSLADKMLGTPDAQKVKSYGLAIKRVLKYAGKDMNTQQQIISNIFEDS